MLIKIGFPLYRLMLIIFLTTCATELQAALTLSTERTISGIVLDATSREPLYATDILNEKARAGTSSDSAGFFSLRAPTRRVALLITHIGYKSD